MAAPTRGWGATGAEGPRAHRLLLDRQGPDHRHGRGHLGLPRPPIGPGGGGRPRRHRPARPSWPCSSACARYVAWVYWLAVVMVGGVRHHGRRCPPHQVRRPLRSVHGAVRGGAGRRVRRCGSAPRRPCPSTASTPPRREAFYWATVVATFALGTAAGDMTATSLHFGYFVSGVLFAGLDRRPGARLPALAASTPSSRSGSPTS